MNPRPSGCCAGVDSGGDVLLGEYGGAHRADLHDVDGGELFAQHGFEQYVGEIPAAQGQRLVGSAGDVVTELFESSAARGSG